MPTTRRRAPSYAGRPAPAHNSRPASCSVPPAPTRKHTFPHFICHPTTTATRRWPQQRRHQRHPRHHHQLLAPAPALPEFHSRRRSGCHAPTPILAPPAQLPKPPRRAHRNREPSLSRCATLHSQAVRAGPTLQMAPRGREQASAQSHHRPTCQQQTRPHDAAPARPPT